MSAISQEESFVKQSLFQFISKNVPTANLKAIDDIVLAYVISIIQEASQDPCFVVEGLIELMEGYVPEFADIDPGLICAWVLEMETELPRREGTDSSNVSEDSNSDKLSLTLENLSEMLPPVAKASRSHTTSESSEGAESRPPPVQDDVYSTQYEILQEMFPNSCAMELKHCLSIACGDISRAAATLLHRREQGQALTPAALQQSKLPVCDDRELKSRIIARYSYVDKNAETKEHKPLAPKLEPKKMVRYRDNKIVSLKGERYTEVPKSGADEEHLKKPKKQHCP